jgi:L-iditol 2-dehydrogenase
MDSGMKVAKWYNNKDIRIEEAPVPDVGPGEIKVEVLSCGICGSDICEWYRLPRAPLVPGHELGGRVIETGAGVTGFQVGERVFVAPKIPCMECYYCRKGHHPICSEVPERLPGGFAQYVVVPEAIVRGGTYLLPENMTYDQSTFIEPLACVVRAQRLSNVQAGQTLMIIGCGMSGLLHVKLGIEKGCRVIAADISDYRLSLAKELGADVVVNASRDVALSPGKKKPDTIILCTAAIPAIDQAFNCLDKGGTLVFFAVPDPGQDVVVPINALWMRETTLLTSYYCGPDDIQNAIEYINTGTIKVDDMITHKLPLDQIGKGFALVLDGSRSLKVIIHPNED